MDDGARRYSPAAQALHWSVAVLVLAVWPLGAVISFIVEDAKLTFYMLHESLGLLILWLMLARLAVRLLRRPPPALPMQDWERRLAATVHVSLYVCLLVQPVLGFLATNAFGFPLDWFWLVPIPSPIGEDPVLAPRLMAAHVAVGYAILVLFLLHMAGILYHRLILRDRQIERMI